MGIGLADLLKRDPVMTAVATAALLMVIGASAFIMVITRYRRHEVADDARIDCARIIRIIDDAFRDRRLSRIEISAIEDASMALRASATPKNGRDVARCVGLPPRRAHSAIAPATH